ncbi:MAG: alpha/beta hydrolase [Pseudomonadota bacterium]
MAAVYSTFDQEALDREYSPSSLVTDIGIYLAEYRRRSSQAVARSRENQSVHTDIRYGTTRAEALDLFLPSSADAVPLQIYIHGGFWQLLGKEDSSFAAPMFLEHGAAFAAINYTLAPQKSLSEIVDENRRAIAFLYHEAKRWNVNRQGFFLSGSSAGAHLVMMMLATDWSRYGLPEDPIAGACAVSGVYDLEPVRLSYVNDKVGMDEGEARRNSPSRIRLRSGCPIVLAYGDNETAEFKRQTDEYLAAVSQAGHEVSFLAVPDRNHFDVILDLCDENSALAGRVLEQMGLGPGSG